LHSTVAIVCQEAKKKALLDDERDIRRRKRNEGGERESK